MTEQKNILITGASGFIGREIVNRLHSQGHQILALTNGIRSTKKKLGKKARVFHWGQTDTLLKQHPKIDVIINLAGANIGSKRWTIANRARLLTSRVITTQKLATLIEDLETPPQTWIQASAIGYYGYQQREAADESFPQGEGFLADLTAQWEQALPKLPATNIIRLRFGVVIHPKSAFIQAFLKPKGLNAVARIGSGDNIISWIHLTDLTQLIEEALDYKTDRLINATTPHPITMLLLVETLRKKYRRKFTLQLPPKLLSLQTGKEKMDELLLADQNIYPGELLKEGFNYQYPHFEDCFR